VLAICCFSLPIVGLDTTIVNVALPSIHNELHASVSGLQWVIDALRLVLASLLMLAGSTADRIGRKRVFRAGLAVFSLGSLLCGLAPSDDPRERAQVIGAWGAVFGLSRRNRLRSDRTQLRGRHPRRVVDLCRAPGGVPCARPADDNGVGGADRPGHRRAPARRRAATHAERIQPARAGHPLAIGIQG
jgi:hypothetical protein